MKGLEKGPLPVFKGKLFLVIVISCFSFTASAQLELRGEITQGALIIGKTEAGSAVTFDGQLLPVSETGDFVFGFGRDDDRNYQLKIRLASGGDVTRNLKPSKRNYNIQKISGISQKIMKPSPAAVARSKKDNAQVKTAREIVSKRRDFVSGFTAPSNGQITGIYGSQRIFNGEPKRPHFGLDYAGKTGDPVFSPADGIVTLFVPDMFYSGGTLIIDHGHGVSSTFLHLSKSLVNIGDEVEQGQHIAEIGASGRATGPHLDWRVNWQQVRLDPALALQIK